MSILDSPVRSRRAFVRGGGLALSLPHLPSLQARRFNAEPCYSPPLRAAFLHFPNGAWMQDWTPTSSGSGLRLSSSLNPLSPHRNELTVITGLDKQHSRTSDGHAHKTANFLTGMPVRTTTEGDFSAGGISVDQRIATLLQGATPIPSLVLGVEPIPAGIDASTGVTLLYSGCISWQSMSRPVLPQNTPAAVFDSLFSAGGAEQGTSVARVSLLSKVLEHSHSLRRRLGRIDQQKLDEYLESVHQMETRLRFESQNPDHRSLKYTPADFERPLSPRKFSEHLTAMLDLIVLAFQMDATRVVSLMMANDVSQQVFEMPDGITDPHHSLSHHQLIADRIRQYQWINRWYVQNFSLLLSRLRGISEGDGTLLDYCMLAFGSGMSDGNEHHPDDLPIVLAAGQQTGIQGNRHLQTPVGTTPLCNLYLSMLQRFNSTERQFGDSDGILFLVCVGSAGIAEIRTVHESLPLLLSGSHSTRTLRRQDLEHFSAILFSDCCHSAV